MISQISLYLWVFPRRGVKNVITKMLDFYGNIWAASSYNWNEWMRNGIMAALAGSRRIDVCRILALLRPRSDNFRCWLRTPRQADNKWYLKKNSKIWNASFIFYLPKIFKSKFPIKIETFKTKFFSDDLRGMTGIINDSYHDDGLTEVERVRAVSNASGTVPPPRSTVTSITGVTSAHGVKTVPKIQGIYWKKINFWKKNLFLKKKSIFEKISPFWKK